MSGAGPAYRWVPDPAARGAWLADRFDREPVGLSDWVPGGFDAYVRVLHPFSRDRPETGDWAAHDALMESERWAEAPRIAAGSGIEAFEISRDTRELWAPADED